MPSIDNTLVRQQSFELAQLFSEPESFMRAVRKILQKHADPALRQSLILAINSPLNGFGTPLPVLKTVRNTLRKPTLRNPDAALTLADALWAAQSREERWLAAELLGMIAEVRDEEVTLRLNRWLDQVDHYDVADALAESAGGPWLRSDPVTHLQQIRTWLVVGSRYRQRYALMSLLWLAEDRSYGDVVAVINVLPSSLYQLDVEVRNVIPRVLRELTLKNATPVVNLLRDWANTLDRNAHWVVRHSLDNLDQDTRQALLVQLRGRG